MPRVPRSERGWPTGVNHNGKSGEQNWQRTLPPHGAEAGTLNCGADFRVDSADALCHQLLLISIMK